MKTDKTKGIISWKEEFERSEDDQGAEQKLQISAIFLKIFWFGY